MELYMREDLVGRECSIGDTVGRIIAVTFGPSDPAPVVWFEELSPNAGEVCSVMLNAIRFNVCKYTVRLTNPGSEKIKMIKTVREFTGLGLKESKDIVDFYGGRQDMFNEQNQPFSREIADKFVKAIRDAGGDAEIRTR